MDSVSVRIYQPIHPDGFAAGELLSGELVVPRRVCLKSAVLRFAGKARSRWTSASFGIPLLRTGRSKLVRESYDIDLANANDIGCSHGCKRIQFALVLPTRLRQSFGTDGKNEESFAWLGEVYYYIRVRAIDDRGKQHEAKEYLAIRPDSMGVARAKDASRANHIITQGIKLCSSNGSIVATLSLGRRIVLPGDTVEATVMIHNHTDATVRGVRLKALQSLAMRTVNKGPLSVVRTKCFDDILCETSMTTLSVAPHTSKSTRVTLQWPDAAQNPRHPEGFTCAETPACENSISDLFVNDGGLKGRFAPGNGLLLREQQCENEDRRRHSLEALTISHSLQVAVEMEGDAGIPLECASGCISALRLQSGDPATDSHGHYIVATIPITVAALPGNATHRRNASLRQSRRAASNNGAGIRSHGVGRGIRAEEAGVVADIVVGKFRLRRHPRYQSEMCVMQKPAVEVHVTPPTPVSDLSIRSFNFGF